MSSSGRHRLGRGIAAFATLLVAVAGGGYLFLLASLPQIEGTIPVPGLDAPVMIVRDRFAVPHIEARSLTDAAFAQGFVHAQDRLWQMEFQRRVGAGRLAEIVGAPALPTDRFMRLMGFHQLAQASLDHMEPATVRWLEAYATGVNAQLAARKGPLPPEFLILRHFALEPWRPADSLVWLRMMALDLGMNWRNELLRARLARRLSREQIADLWPDYPDSAPVTLAGPDLGRALDRLAEVLPPAPAFRPGSNAWVLAGGRTKTGAPLLANDPHLELRAPGPFYLTHVTSPELDIVGATLPGVPGVVLGHNGHIAWGFTNTGGDVQDLFVERVDPQDPKRYLTPDGSAPFAVREETIRVRGGPPETFRVRSTRHGPVLSDLLPDPEATFGADHVVALAWTALAEDDISMQGLLGLNQARGWESFVAALEDVVSPQQNILYADTAGHVGFFAPARVPIRKRGDGRWPVPGWTGEYDWAGFIPFEALPHQLDPPDGAIFNANNRVVPDDYPYLITRDWDPPHRARRIAELLDHGAHDLQSFAAMQADQRSMMAQGLLPLMLRAEPATPAAREALARLERWDLTMRPDAAEPLIFAAWYRELSRLVYADELGDLFRSTWRDRPQFMERVLQDRQVWCDDVDTAPVETCAAQAARALDQAIAGLEQRFGADPEQWRWGDAHPAVMAHPVLGGHPLLGRLFDIELPSGGDSTTLNVGAYAIADPQAPFVNIHAPSYRALYDLADLDGSRFVAATGQSGHPLSPHYRDLARIWARAESIPMWRRAEAYGADAISRLQLVPAD